VNVRVDGTGENSQSRPVDLFTAGSLDGGSDLGDNPIFDQYVACNHAIWKDESGSTDGNRSEHGARTNPNRARWGRPGYIRAVATKTLDWLLIGRYALLIALTALIPVPLLDRGIENYLRRRMVRAIARRHEIQLCEADVTTLAHAPSGGCFGCLWSVVTWPVRKILKTVLFVWQVKTIADSASEMVHRALMLEEAMESGWIPGDAQGVRKAMDSALTSVDTRLVERQIAGVFQDHTNDLNKLIYQTTALARADVIAAAVEADELSTGATGLTQAMTAALQSSGVVPELLQWFRAEMGVGPLEGRGVAGLLEAAAILPADEVDDPLDEGVWIEEAEEVEE
jgi:hypothetical protein